MRFEKVELENIMKNDARRSGEENNNFVREFLESGYDAAEVFWDKDYKSVSSAYSVYFAVVKRLNLRDEIRVRTNGNRLFFVRVKK